MDKRLASANYNYYDVNIMDVSLLKMNGFDLANALRTEKVKTPILM